MHLKMFFFQKNVIFLHLGFFSPFRLAMALTSYAVARGHGELRFGLSRTRRNHFSDTNKGTKHSIADRLHSGFEIKTHFGKFDSSESFKN